MRNTEKRKIEIMDNFYLDENGNLKLKEDHELRDARIHFFITSANGERVTIPKAQIVHYLATGETIINGETLVDHKNDNPLDDHPDNLQIITYRENTAKRRDKQKEGQVKYAWCRQSKHDVCRIRCYIIDISVKWSKDTSINNRIYLSYVDYPDLRPAKTVFNTKEEATKYCRELNKNYIVIDSSREITRIKAKRDKIEATRKAVRNQLNEISELYVGL